MRENAKQYTILYDPRKTKAGIHEQITMKFVGKKINGQLSKVFILGRFDQTPESFKDTLQKSFAEAKAWFAQQNFDE